MIQSVLPVAIFGNSKSTITMEGGTDVNFTPPLDYVKNVIKILIYMFIIKRFKINIILLILGFIPYLS